MRRLSIPEAARLLNVPEQAIWKKIERGTLQYSKENGRIFVHVQEMSQPEPNFSQSSYYEEPQMPNQTYETPPQQNTQDSNDTFELFLKNLIEQKDEQLVQLKEENRELHEKLETALRENNQLSQGVHLEARKLLEIILPNYNMKKLDSESNKLEHKKEKKKKNKNKK